MGNLPTHYPTVPCHWVVVDVPLEVEIWVSITTYGYRHHIHVVGMFRVGGGRGGLIFDVKAISENYACKIK